MMRRHGNKVTKTPMLYASSDHPLKKGPSEGWCLVCVMLPIMGFQWTLASEGLPKCNACASWHDRSCPFAGSFLRIWWNISCLWRCNCKPATCNSAGLSFAASWLWFDLLACHCLILCAIQRLVIFPPTQWHLIPELKTEVDGGADWLSLHYVRTWELNAWFQDLNSETECIT
jgi:hypothetical protein